jgi:hypothetical protein
MTMIMMITARDFSRFNGKIWTIRYCKIAAAYAETPA